MDSCPGGCPVGGESVGMSRQLPIEWQRVGFDHQPWDSGLAGFDGFSVRESLSGIFPWIRFDGG